MSCKNCTVQPINQENEHFNKFSFDIRPPLEDETQASITLHIGDQDAVKLASQLIMLVKDKNDDIPYVSIELNGTI